MTAVIETARGATGGAGLRARLGAVWRQPLYHSGCRLLIADSVLTATIGVAYWLVAARMYPPEVVGANAAVISAMIFVAAVAQPELMSALLRFVPVASAAAPRMIALGYLAGAALAGLASAVFLGGLRAWAPDLTAMLASWPVAAGFVLATMCWVVFVLQDTALVAVGRAAAVPVENLVFALVKLGLVAAFAAAVPQTGVWLSWAVGTAVAVVATTGYLFVNALPAFTGSGTRLAVPPARELRDSIGPDYLGSMAWVAATSLVPILVLHLTGADHAAAFALAWSICIVLYPVPMAFGQSLVTHGALDQDRIDELYRTALRRSLFLLIPVVAVVVVGARLLLTPFGPWYADQAADTLRLLALSALPYAVVCLAVDRARVRHRTTTVVAALGGVSTIVLALTVVLAPAIGIVGAGSAWLTGQVAVAAVLLQRPRLRRIRRTLAVVPTPAEWSAEQALPSRSAGGGPGVLKVASTELGVLALRRESEMLRRLAADERLGDWRRLLPQIVEVGEYYLLTGRLAGRAGWHEPGLTAAAVAAITPLHRLDQAVVTMDPALLARWVDEPMELVKRALPARDDRAAADWLTARLHAELVGATVRLGWTHGAFYPGNLLVAGGRVSGIVEWAEAREQDLPALDLVHWLLTVQPTRSELGAQVTARLIHRPCWSPREKAVLGTELPCRTLLLLGWLRQVSTDLCKSQRDRTSPGWLRRNVISVLRAAPMTRMISDD